MPRRRGNRNRRNGRSNGNTSGVTTPQRSNRIIDLTKFDPTRIIKVASETSLDSSNPVKTLSINANGGFPGTGIGAASSLLSSFDRARILYIDVFFDQRGSSSTASQPRVTAWVANGASGDYDQSKITELARFAGSGINTMVPGKRFRISTPPSFQVGRFDDVNITNGGTLLIASKDFSGTVRMETAFQVYGPPIDYQVSP